MNFWFYFRFFLAKIFFSFLEQIKSKNLSNAWCQFYKEFPKAGDKIFPNCTTSAWDLQTSIGIFRSNFLSRKPSIRKSEGRPYICNGGRENFWMNHVEMSVYWLTDWLYHFNVLWRFDSTFQNSDQWVTNEYQQRRVEMSKVSKISPDFGIILSIWHHWQRNNKRLGKQ